MTATSSESARSAVADALARLPVDARAASFRALASDEGPAVFEALDGPQQRELLEALEPDEARRLLARLPADTRVRALDELAPEAADALVRALPEPERELTELLRRFPRESAGRMMTPHVVAIAPGDTVAEALARLRSEARHADALLVLPVTGDDGRLDGVVRLTDLVTSPPGAEVAGLVDRSYPVASCLDDREPVARLIQEEDLLAIPVVDEERRPLGLVTVDDAMEVLEREGSEDLALASAAGVLGVPYHAASVGRIVRSRIVWLLLLVAAATLTVSVLDAYEETLREAVTLALFIPLLIGTGGNCGAQAATTMTRALAVGDVRVSDLVPSVLKEARVGLSLGLLFGAIGFLPVALIWSADIAAAVSLTLVAICVWATTAGALLPLLASRVGVDPAVVSAPLVTSLVDATGLVIYFGIAEAVVL